MGRLRATTICGSSQYIAPEVAYCRNRGSYGAPVDIWSSGVVLYVLLSGHPPWEPDKVPSPHSSHTDVVPFWPQTWGTVSDEAKAFVSALLIVNPQRRPTADATLQLPWLGMEAEVEAAAKRRLSVK